MLVPFVGVGSGAGVVAVVAGSVGIGGDNVGVGNGGDVSNDDGNRGALPTKFFHKLASHLCPAELANYTRSGWSSDLPQAMTLMPSVIS